MISPRPADTAAYTLLEVMVAANLSAIVLAPTMTGVVALQKSYASTEEYATGMADQMRLLDYLALDLRRAVAVPANGSVAAQAAWVMDADDQGLTVNVPNYYLFNTSDTQHSFPVANAPVYNPTTAVVSYPDPINTSVTTQKVAYRFTNGAITRTDPWAPLVTDPKTGKSTATGPVTIATNMDAFPTITADPSHTDGSVVRYNVVFHSIFHSASADTTNAITLHNVTFVRSVDLAR